VIGVNTNRLLFSGVRGRLNPYLIQRDGERFKLEAGSMHGVGLYTHFSVWLSISDEGPVGTFTVADVYPAHCIGEINFRVHGDPVEANKFSALVTNREAKDTLKLHVTDSAEKFSLAGMIQRSVQNISKNSDTRLFEVLDYAEGAHMTINMCDNKLALEYTGDLFKLFPGLTPPRIRPFDPKLIENVLDGAQRFLCHLNRAPGGAKSSGRILDTGKVKIQIFELKDTGRGAPESTGVEVPILDRKSIIELKGRESPPYGIAITNNTRVELHVSVFYFDCNDLSISARPSCSFVSWNVALIPLSVCYSSSPNQGASVQAPLVPGGKTLTIGYDSPDQGGVPFSFCLPVDRDVEVGFFKLFLSNVPVDLSVIEQPSPLSNEYRATKSVISRRISFWDEITIAMEQRLKLKYDFTAAEKGEADCLHLQLKPVMLASSLCSLRSTRI
jgi:hypothetical protein